MSQRNKSFRHESLQDSDSVRDILEAITRGLERGSLSLSDGDGRIDMKPEGLLSVKVTASEEDSEQRLNLRLSWQAAGTRAKKGKLKVR